MSDSVAKILWEASEGASRWGVSYEGARPDLKESVERGARAVALHVLEVACPGSPILAAMKAGASFEEAVERERIRKDAWCVTCNGGHYPPGVICPTCRGSGVDPAKAAAAREAMSRAAERIDEPTGTELAAAIGDIFAGIASCASPRCGTERRGQRCDLEAGHAGACCSSRDMRATDLFWDRGARARSRS